MLPVADWNHDYKQGIRERLAELLDKERIGTAKLLMAPELAILSHQPAMGRILRGLQQLELRYLEDMVNEEPTLTGVARRQGLIKGLRLFTNALRPESDMVLEEIKVELSGLTEQIQQLQTLLGHDRLQPTPDDGSGPQGQERQDAEHF
jgi:hypothetical protein